ncbi:MAG TPA: FAD-dependent oxidoreductase, partial [Candidatus Sulfopaludibacter sp.]|nr:FAD-dependent oxidoreductase [Candidatus Sulfopaludibacter sp.]
MSQTVAILGGGVAGLSAAHELAERGFRVHVLERRAVLGGKARSIPVPDSALPGGQPLPGEHGFRFFPGFYKHVTDTMRRIPYGARGNVFDNLTVATRILLARAGQTEITWVARSPENLEDLRVFLVELFTPFGVPAEELAYFITRLLMVATSCRERRLAEFENIAWWEFIAAPRMSKAYQAYLGQGLTRSLVAMRAEEGSTRTVGAILWQLLYGLICPDRVFDRLLCGPTSDVWIDPWTQYLQQLGVEFSPRTPVAGIATDGARVTGIGVDGGPPVEADFYIAALPVEVMAPLLTDDLK